MCVSCGCGEPNERHGDDRHITQDDLDQAAAAAEISSPSASDGPGKCSQMVFTWGESHLFQVSASRGTYSTGYCRFTRSKK